MKPAMNHDTDGDVFVACPHDRCTHDDILEWDRNAEEWKVIELGGEKLCSDFQYFCCPSCGWSFEVPGDTDVLTYIQMEVCNHVRLVKTDGQERWECEECTKVMQVA